MKNLFKITVAVFALAVFSFNANAQVGFSAGLELGTSLDDGFGMGFGVTAGVEAPMGDKGGITGRLGYIILTMDDVFGDNGSAALLPIQAGYKYYFTDNTSGGYVHGQLGMTMFKYSYDYTSYDYNYTTGTVTETSETFSYSEMKLSYAFGGGYLINENIDLGVRYNIVSFTGGNLDYFGLRAAYNF